MNLRFQGKRLTLGITGGIAAYKVPELVRMLTKEGIGVFPVATVRALEFVTPLVLETLSGNPVLCSQKLEHAQIGHIERAQSVDGILVAPATANTLAKMAQGIADNVLLDVLLASDPRRVIVCPAMNTAMWEHPATRQNIEKIKGYGVYVVDPDVGELACKTNGAGRLAPLDEILYAVERLLAPKGLEGRRVVVTAGPTREHVDAVRFLSNPSSGRMGIALAKECWYRGADVTLVLGPSDHPVPKEIRLERVTSALEMLEALQGLLSEATILIMNAAVADFRPSRVVPYKFRKADIPLTLLLEPNPDILKTLAASKLPNQLFVGFAAETDGERAMATAKRKLEEKSLDMIVANDVSKKTAGFGSAFNAGVILLKTGEPKVLGHMSKEAMAARIVDEIVHLAAQTSPSSLQVGQ